MSLADVKGQEHVARFFRQVVKNDKLAHAYIFAGPEGVGKALFARQLAKFILCQAGIGDSCDRCPSCLQVERDCHPDVTWISSPTSERELARKRVVEMRRQVGLKALTGSHKIFIIDNAEKLNEESANLLLLTLEEPPAGSLFLLLTSAVERLLPTIRSRCQLLRFKPVSQEAVTELLIAQAGIGTVEAKLLSALSGGSPGQALSWSEGKWLPSRRKLLDRLIQVKPVEAFSLAETITASARKGTQSRIEARWNLVDILGMLLGFYRGLWRQGIGARQAVIEGDEELTRKLGLSGETARKLLEEVLVARQRIRANANITLVLAELFSQLAELQGN